MAYSEAQKMATLKHRKAHLKMVTIDVTPEEKGAIKEAAEKSGLSARKFIVKSAYEELKKIKGPNVDPFIFLYLYVLTRPTLPRSCKARTDLHPVPSDPANKDYLSQCPP